MPRKRGQKPTHYTSLLGTLTACGRPVSEWSLLARTYAPSIVTCQACKRTAAYHAALATLALEAAHG